MGTNRETKDNFQSSHFDEPNILVHLRMNTRTDADGNKVLFLEEVQSDWGQKGKKEGFDGKKAKDVHVVVTTGIKDVQVGNGSVMLPSVQGAFQNQMAQFFTHMLWLRANTTPESGDAQAPKSSI